MTHTQSMLFTSIAHFSYTCRLIHVWDCDILKINFMAVSIVYACVANNDYSIVCKTLRNLRVVYRKLC